MRRALPIVLPTALAGCDGLQSALQPGGPAAGSILDLLYLLVGVNSVVFFAVIGFAVYAVKTDPARHPKFSGHVLIVGGGIALPVLVLAGYLVLGILTSTELTRAAPAGALRVEMVGRQWWWEVRYRGPGGETVVSANELRIPAGRPVEIALEAGDVIHSFWVPRLAGKIDMIPGRTNRILIEADAAGIYRGQCAEYCGGPHALMAFYVLAMPPAEFEAWLRREAAPAAPPDHPFLARGQTLFVENGCGACHTVRGTAADGRLGPDLTHLGTRRSLGAGILPLNVGTIAGWIVDSQTLKPGNKMPAFNTFSGEDLRALAAWLESLQ